MNNRGLALYHMGKSDEALFSFNEALIFDDSDPTIWFNRGNLHLSMRQEENIELAIQDYDQACIISPANPIFFHAKGLAMQALAENKEE